MTSNFITNLFVELGRAVYEIIRKGRRISTIVGAIVGGCIGATSARVVDIEFVPALVALGLIVGATLTAAIFRRPQAALGSRSEDPEPFQPGAMLHTWKFEPGDADTLIVLFEKAVYVVQNDNAPWSEVIEKLSRGIAPDLAGECFIRLADLLRVEMVGASASQFTLIYRSAGRIKRRDTVLTTAGERDELLAAVETQLGRSCEWTERPMGLARAVSVPAVFIGIIVVLSCAIAWLAAYWTANPPPPPRGKAEQDDLVKLLIWTKPRGVILAGAAATVPFLAWFGFRYYHPPLLRVFLIAPDKDMA
jgi:hypothetical protein